MRREGFNRIFWGFIFVFIDIRLNSIDLILPDFVGYILIAKGLTLLSTEHQAFQKARYFAVAMIFLSLLNFVEVKSDSRKWLFFKRQLLSSLTNDLSHSLPDQVNSASLVRTTNSRSEIDTNRGRNPQQDGDAILGEYSDGTVVLILRYSSPEEATTAMSYKSAVDYSFEALKKRGETNATNWSNPRGESYFDNVKTSARSDIQTSDRVIKQWWYRGSTWWNPVSWGYKEGWDGRLLYIVEGYPSSAEDYQSAIDGKINNRGSVLFIFVSPAWIVGQILETILIWGICSGIIALSLSSNNQDLMNIAKGRRLLYAFIQASGITISIIWIVASYPESRGINSAFGGLLVIYVLAIIIASFLILGLMRKAENSLDNSSVPVESAIAG